MLYHSEQASHYLRTLPAIRLSLSYPHYLCSILSITLYYTISPNILCTLPYMILHFITLYPAHYHMHYTTHYNINYTIPPAHYPLLPAHYIYATTHYPLLPARYPIYRILPYAKYYYNYAK